MNRTDSDSPQDFSARQGQYLAFIHAYTNVNGRPSAGHGAVLPRHPANRASKMILTLEKAGFLSRQPASPRAIVVLVDPAKLPALEPGFAQHVKISVPRY